MPWKIAAEFVRDSSTKSVCLKASYTLARSSRPRAPSMSQSHTFVLTNLGNIQIRGSECSTDPAVGTSNCRRCASSASKAAKRAALMSSARSDAAVSLPTMDARTSSWPRAGSQPRSAARPRSRSAARQSGGPSAPAAAITASRSAASAPPAVTASRNRPTPWGRRRGARSPTMSRLANCVVASTSPRCAAIASRLIASS